VKQDRLLILTEYFYPDTASGTGRIMTELAEDLAERGFAVSVICGQPSYIAQQRVARYEDWHGLSITRLSELPVSRHSGVGRVASWAWFLLECVVRVPLWRRRYNHVLVVTNPSPAVAIGWLIKRGRAASYAVLVHDVFPENAVAVGMLREDSVAARLMKSLNRTALHAADAVITIGDDMKQLLCADYQLAPGQVQVIPNWDSASDAPEGTDADDTEYWRHFLDLGNRFLVLYAGNFGFAQDADLLIQCLKACSSMDDVLFCFVGDGGQYERLRQEERSKDVQNLRVVSFQTGTRYSSLLKLAGCGLVSLHPRMRGMGLPSKVTTYMAAGLPVICMAEQNSDLTNIVDRANAGFTCQTPVQFADAVHSMASDGQLRDRFAAGALEAADTVYSRSQCISLFAEVLSRISDMDG